MQSKTKQQNKKKNNNKRKLPRAKGIYDFCEINWKVAQKRDARSRSLSHSHSLPNCNSTDFWFCMLTVRFFFLFCFPLLFVTKDCRIFWFVSETKRARDTFCWTIHIFRAITVCGWRFYCNRYAVRLISNCFLLESGWKMVADFLFFLC